MEEEAAAELISQAVKFVQENSNITVRVVSLVLINDTSHTLREVGMFKSGGNVEEYKLSVEPKAAEIMGVFFGNKIFGVLRSMRVGAIYQVGFTDNFLFVGFASSWVRANRVGIKLVNIADREKKTFEELGTNFTENEIDHNELNKTDFSEDFFLEASMGESCHTVARFRIIEKPTT